jgi:hypothetical protein
MSEDFREAWEAAIEMYKVVKADNIRLRKGIKDYLDGNFEGPHSGRAGDPRYKCKHDRPYWEACDSCIDEHFTDVLEGK